MLYEEALHDSILCIKFRCYLLTIIFRLRPKKSLIRRGSAPRSKPLLFYVPFLTEKVTLSHIFDWKWHPIYIPIVERLHLFSAVFSWVILLSNRMNHHKVSLFDVFWKASFKYLNDSFFLPFPILQLMKFLHFIYDHIYIYTFSLKKLPLLGGASPKVYYRKYPWGSSPPPLMYTLKFLQKKLSGKVRSRKPSQPVWLVSYEEALNCRHVESYRNNFSLVFTRVIENSEESL